MKKQWLQFFLLGCMAFATMASCKTEKKDAKKEQTEVTATKYQCPMDCEKGKIYDAIGSCPVCKMDLAAKGETKAEDGDQEEMCQCPEGECECGGKENCKCGTPGYDHKGNKLDEMACNMDKEACKKKMADCKMRKEECAAKKKECKMSEEECEKAGCCQDREAQPKEAEGK
ncbi:MAG: hypothetical protein OIF50_15660 [Flavobacteriaceae bacterium]|nr:hypothetical protein [Flavobacteriaceae bacterium]